MISFIIPTSTSHAYHIDNLSQNILSQYPSADIVVVEQTDEPYKKGQCVNSVIDECEHELIVIMDCDIRFIGKTEFGTLMKKFNCCFLPWRVRHNIVENGINEFESLNERIRGGWGGLVCLTKRQFKDSGGFSNLFSGWGGEDSVFIQRQSSCKRTNDPLFHIKHRDKPLEKTPQLHNQRTKHNSHLWRNSLALDGYNDGYKQTIATMEETTQYEDVRHFKISNITIPADFKYKHLSFNGELK